MKLTSRLLANGVSLSVMMRAQRPRIAKFRSRPKTNSSSVNYSSRQFSSRAVSLREDYKSASTERSKKPLGREDKAADDEAENSIRDAKSLQTRTPWHREGSDKAPAKRERRTSAMTKGKLLTTPSRLLKLVLPLTMLSQASAANKNIEPLALLVHPQQPLSYLERLIQSEVPMIESKDGKEKSPEVHFYAEDSIQDDIQAKKGEEEEEAALQQEAEEQGSEEQMVDGKLVKVGKIDSSKKDGQKAAELKLRGGPGEGGVESYSGKGRERTSAKGGGDRKFVRWSSSTEIGDFIRDAARGKEIAVQIEGAPQEIRVGVPSFYDRTHYLRIRLRKTSRKLVDFAGIKKECDEAAHRSGQRLGIGGFGILSVWFVAIYYFTFQTSYGWDTMEPITYLAGLSSIMIGYVWFLYHNREVSYRSALHLTISRRQNSLYQARGFDLRKWEALIEDANELRKEIKMIAEQYDVDWDEMKDEGSEEVHDALKEGRRKERKEAKEDEDDDDDLEDDSVGKGKEKVEKQD